MNPETSPYQMAVDEIHKCNSLHELSTVERRLPAMPFYQKMSLKDITSLKIVVEANRRRIKEGRTL